MDDFIKFRSFTEEAPILEISAILKTENVPHKIADSRKDFDPSMTNSIQGKDIDILLSPKDFLIAENLINKKIELNEDLIDPEHFLFEFNVDELFDVIKNADEWHPLDVKLANKILTDKGIQVTESKISSLRQERFEEKSKPEKTSSIWIVVGYIAAALGGFLGFFIGTHLMNFKKTMPDGTQIYNYTENDRRHGKWIFLLACLSLIFYIIYFTLKK